MLGSWWSWTLGSSLHSGTPGPWRPWALEFPWCLGTGHRVTGGPGHWGPFGAWGHRVPTDACSHSLRVSCTWRRPATSWTPTVSLRTQGSGLGTQVTGGTHRVVDPLMHCPYRQAGQDPGAARGCPSRDCPRWGFQHEHPRYRCAGTLGWVLGTWGWGYRDGVMVGTWRWVLETWWGHGGGDVVGIWWWGHGDKWGHGGGDIGWGHGDHTDMEVGTWGCGDGGDIGMAVGDVGVETWWGHGDRGQVVGMGEGDLGVGIGNMVGPQGGTGVRGGGDRRAKGTWGT